MTEPRISRRHLIALAGMSVFSGCSQQPESPIKTAAPQPIEPAPPLPTPEPARSEAPPTPKNVNPNRITFEGNPWPKGHGIKDMQWMGRLDSGGRLWFDLHLATEEYSADAPGIEVEADDDWTAPGVWNNYHRCTLSSRKWRHKGLLAATPDKPIQFAKLGELEFTADPLPPPASDDLDEADRYARGFGIYLLGHDGVADHKVKLTPDVDGTFSLLWQGKVALEYYGGTDFKYRFSAAYKGLSFSGLRLPDGTTEAAGRETVRQLIPDIGDLKLHEQHESIWLVPA